MVIPNLKFSKMGKGGGAFWSEIPERDFLEIWTTIYCAARNLLVHHSSLSHTTYVETNKIPACKFFLYNFSIFHLNGILNQLLKVSRPLNIYHSNQEALSLGKQHYTPLTVCGINYVFCFSVIDFYG